MKDYLLFSGSSNMPLAQDVAKLLNISLGKVDLTRFADGELRPWIESDVRDKTIIILQSFSYPMDEHIIEMVLMGDAIRRMAPKSIISVIPYFGYARQDKLHRPGEPVSARVIAEFLEISMVSEMLCVDLHNDAIVGFFRIPVTHVSAISVLAAEINKMNITEGVIVSPDVGGVKRARNFAYLTDMPMVVMEKKRFLDKHDTTEMYQIIGDVDGKSAIVVDDIISTAGTIVSFAQSLQQAGAAHIMVAASHGVFAADAIAKLTNSPIESVLITNSINIPHDKLFAKLRIVTIAGLLSDSITTLVK